MAMDISIRMVWMIFSERMMMNIVMKVRIVMRKLLFLVFLMQCVQTLVIHQIHVSHVIKMDVLQVVITVFAVMHSFSLEHGQASLLVLILSCLQLVSSILILHCLEEKMMNISDKLLQV